MTTKGSFLLVTLLLAAALCSPAFAARYQFQLDPDSWAVVDGICTYDRDSQWSYRSNGLDVEELLGCAPPEGLDPRIRQNVLNNTVDDVWTDWHVEIINGTNLRGIQVYKVGEGTLWPYEVYTETCGFLAHVITSGPPNPMAVNPGETLYVEFSYDIVAEPVTVTQYPTTWYEIPEPSSIMALVMGLGALGFGVRRRLGK